MMRTLLKLVVGSYDTYGLPMPTHRLFDAHPSVSTEALHYLKHGRIEVAPDVTAVVESAEGPKLRLADGRELAPDLVVCATGFALSVLFLPPGLVPIEGKVAQVMGPGLLPGHKHLYVLGTQQVRYGIGPLVRPAARLLPRWIRMQDELELPLADALLRMGQKPSTTHLVDPHAALQRMWLAEHLLEGLILRRGRRMHAA